MRIWITPLMLASLWVAGACQQQEPVQMGQAPAAAAEEPVRGDWLVRSLRTEPGTLNPIVATDFSESQINSGMSGHIYETLIYRDPRTLEFKPLLAESWEESPDHLVYTFHLRQGVRWHDGAEFTANDILYSYERIQDPTVKAAHLRSYYQNVEKVEALDDHTVRFTFSKPEYLSFETAGSIPIVPQSVFDDGQDFNTHPAGRAPVGTGPYTFHSWTTGQEIVLERNPGYWGEAIGRSGYVDRIVFRLAQDPTTALQMLKAGQIDVLSDIRAVQWAKQMSSRSFEAKFNKYKFYTPQYSYIGWNTLRPFFADKRCRRAMTQLFNREEFAEKVLYGLSEVISGGLFFLSPYYDSSIEPWPYDPEAARRLLDEAGWLDHDGDGIRDKDGVKFEFTFSLPAESKSGEKIGTLLKEELEKVGIVMHIEKQEWALFIERIHEKNFDATTLRWMSPWSVDLYQIWHSSSAGPGGSNAISYKNPEVDRIAEALRTTFDEEERIRLCHRFHQIVHEEQPYTFLFCDAELMAVDKRFRGVETFRIRPGYELLEWWVPEQLQKYR